ncbi:hypothetical protein [Bradyrhizobium sp. OAE829]|uniref:hypothetical protein n=1 Tax=Bradyrhizobium sp. OAE829 TaxID=2663807 RepID=UPI00178BF0CE
MKLDRIVPSIVRVGNGRGFVVQVEREKLVVTAAHGLPRLPPSHAASYDEERTYPNFVGPVGEEPTVWIECLFVDPIADIAVLGPPSHDDLYDQRDAYNALLDGVDPIAISEVRRRKSEAAWMLSLDMQWRRCTVRNLGGPLWVSDGAIESGMSGSPIVLGDGSAIGAVSIGNGQNPCLGHNLPGWILKKMDVGQEHVRWL